MNVISPLSFESADALAHVARDGREPVFLSLHLAIEVCIGQGDGRNRGQGLEESTILVVVGLAPAAARDAQPEGPVGQVQRGGQGLAGRALEWSG